ncbi:prepilin-type N-terminal cleavage/methylation domain-containing protein [Rubrivivax gelatinosus]|uniref:Pilus assembly protein PilV n=1 Tax=Rubrivivax gelatinosus TaxID=28068 RepID=A0ABS1DVF6_RUBGE|nr:prepilin-type N-terminal cleavage/methylation domain-containing protein [Rubrivivax gelatinosus]MBK1713713.1 pilus assembly protein PilV [Rubrivivax gelatinosus]
MNKPSRPVQRGVSLVEAMVALAVMAIGLLGVVGLQATLRANADLSRQRSEAVRIAQDRIDQLRAYTSLDDIKGETYDGIAAAPGERITATNVNTEYTLYQDVQTLAAGRAKTVSVKVAWRDRRSETDNQWVDFGTLVTGVPPALAGALVLPANQTVLSTPSGRNPAIPVQAQDNGDGSSTFRPLGGEGVGWVFNNVTGVITSICTPGLPCVSTKAYLLAGYVRFATGHEPTAADAEVPSAIGETDQDSVLSPFVTVQRTGSPLPAADSCVHRLYAGFVAYWCAVPLGTGTAVWSGRSTLHLSNLATLPVGDVPDTRSSADAVRVCRYTTALRPTRNVDHPLDYVDVGGALTNQNFLVISAGDGSNRYACPADDPDTQPMTLTLEHQPEPVPTSTTP